MANNIRFIDSCEAQSLNMKFQAAVMNQPNECHHEKFLRLQFQTTFHVMSMKFKRAFGLGSNCDFESFRIVICSAMSQVIYQAPRGVRIPRITHVLGHCMSD